MDKRQQLIEMITGNADGSQGRKQTYNAHVLLMPKGAEMPPSWEAYQEQRQQGEWLSFGKMKQDAFDWVKPDEAWKLTPEQAQQLGHVNGNEIVVALADARRKLYDWGLIKLWGKANARR